MSRLTDGSRTGGDGHGDPNTAVPANNTPQPQAVHLGIEIEQVTPSSDLRVATPARRQPQEPIEIAANSTVSLTSIQMKHLFDHIPSNEVSAPAGLFDSYTNGSFGLLPEGLYKAHITAYRWSVCYSAQAPKFMTPTVIGTKEPGVAEIDPFNAQFTWIAPVMTCNSRAIRYEYTLRVVEIPEGWGLDQAMDHGIEVYRQQLIFAQCIIPQHIITQQFYPHKRYAAQVTARSTSTNPMDYMMIANNGKSEPLVFRIKTSDEPEKKKTEDDDADDDGDDDGDDDDEGEGFYYERPETVRNDDIEEFLNVVRLSGNSSATLLQNCYSVTDVKEQGILLACAIAESVVGEKGAFRVHGGGFAGTIQAYVPLDKENLCVRKMSESFGKDSVTKLRIRPYGAVKVL